MQDGAERLCMAPPSVEFFVEAVKQTVLANKKWVRTKSCAQTSIPYIQYNKSYENEYIFEIYNDFL